MKSPFALRSRPKRIGFSFLSLLLIVSGLSVINVPQAQAIGSGICGSTLASPSGITSTVTQSGSFCIVTLTPTSHGASGSGTWTVPNGVTQVEYLVAAGGGAGAGGSASEHGGGGGGAGGVTTGTLNISTSTLSIAVGTGGTGGAINSRGTSGANSSLGSGITMTGGGAGGTYFTNGPLTGGSGGGAGAGNNRTGALGTSLQGNSGGSVLMTGTTATDGRHGAGGGGAGSAGGSTTAGPTITTAAGAGGIGIQNSISGNPVFYGGGGGGGGSSKDAGSSGGGTGGSGVGGTGATWTGTSTTQATAGTAGTGSGGGGGIGTGGANASVGGNGGSGVVIIKYSPNLGVDTSFDFDGSTAASVADDNTLDVANAISIEAWVNPTDTCATEKTIVAKENSYLLFCGGGFWKYALYGSSWSGIATTIPVVANEWHHIAFTRVASTNTVNFYYDGKLAFQGIADGANTSAIGNSAFGLSVGARGAAFTTARFTGKIDEVKIWSEVRTESQIQSGMTARLTPTDLGNSNLVAYYDFNEGADTFLYNLKTNASTATNLTFTGTTLNKWIDVKSQSFNGSSIVTTFPRSYINAAGGWTVPSGVSNVSALLVGGGGGGGVWVAGGGGGGGVVPLSGAAGAVTAGEVLPVIVGAGGVGAEIAANSSALARSAANGFDSSFLGATAFGGGSGSSWTLQSPGRGATGGGTGRTDQITDPSGSITPAQGFAGGKQTATLTDFPAGGGGGAGGVGANPVGANAGNGGAGLGSSITGSPVNYGGGGGGGCHSASGCALGTGTDGGGTGSWQSGSNSVASKGTANRGGGGGGAGKPNPTIYSATGGAGGSGVVIVSFVAVSGSVAITGTQTLNSLQTASTSAVTVVGSPTVSYQWQISADNSTFTNGVTTQTFTPATSAHAYLKVAVTYIYSSVSGSVSLTSAVSGPYFVACSTPTQAVDGVVTYQAFKTVTSGCNWSPPAGVTAIDLLVVAGGGGGGSRHSGGGGAGGLINSTNLSINGRVLSVVVGDGGAGGAAQSTGGSDASDGANSVVSGGGITTLTAIGGGGGGYGSSAGRTGGSGGGGGSSGTGGNGTSGQGSNGSAGLTNNSSYWVGGGGGGAGGAGTTATTTKGGGGGVGLEISWIPTTVRTTLGVGVESSSKVFFAGGGGGGSDRAGVVGGDGGTGGGGAGETVTATIFPGTANTGGGGGGSGISGVGTGSRQGGKGGSGVVVLRYLTAAPTITSQPSSATVVSGNTASLSVTPGSTPTGVTRSYQWQSSTDGTSYSNIAGAINASYSPTVTFASDNGKRFRVVITDTANNSTLATSTTSSAATLTVTQTYAITLGTITRVAGDTTSTIGIATSPSASGTTVTLTVSPKSGMRLKAGTLVATFNTSSTATLSGTGPYTFTMPAFAVTVTAEFESAAVSQTIERTSVTPSTPVKNNTYTPSATATSGLTVAITIASASSSVCSISAGLVTFNSPGSCVIQYDQSGNGSYLAATQLTETVTVVKATPTFTWSGVSKTFGDSTFTVTAPTVTGSLAGSFTYSSATTSVISVSGTTFTVAGGGTSVITATFTPTDTTNYNTATTTMTVTVAAATQTVTWAPTTALSTTASPATPSTTATALGSAPITYSVTSAGTTGCTVDSSTGGLTYTAAGSCVVRASAAATTNYAAATREVTFVISLATRTITIDAGSYTSTYAMTATPPTLTSTPSAGGSDGTKSYASSTTGVCTVVSGTGVVSFVSAGTCTLTATIGAGTTYASATSASISFTTSLATQTVTWAPTTSLATTASPATPSSVATALGLAAITYAVTSAGTTGCTVNSSTAVLTFTAAGSCVVRATAGATSNYAAGTADVTFVIALATRTLTINAGSYSSSYTMVATPPTLASTASAGGGTKSYASSTTGVCTVNSSSGLVAFVSAGTCTLTATIAADSTYASVTSSSISFTTTLATQTVTWAPTTALTTTASPATPSAAASALGSAPITYSVTSAGTTGCTVNSSTGVLTFTAAGSCTVRASAASTTNYAAGTADVTFVITQATVTATFSSNYGTPTTSTQTIPNGISTALTANAFTRSGFTFVGWSANQDGSGTHFRDSQSVTITTNTNFYAKWSAIYATGLIVNLDATQTNSLASNSATTWNSIEPGNTAISSTSKTATFTATPSPGSVTFSSTSTVNYGHRTELEISGDLTVETWIKLDPSFTPVTSLVSIASHWYDNSSGSKTNASMDWYFGIYNGFLNLYTSNGSGVESAIASSKKFLASDAGTWIHVGFVQKANGDVQFYVNGLPDGSIKSSNARRAATTPRLILGLSNASFVGSMSKFRIYSGGLTASQIRSNFNADASAFSITPSNNATLSALAVSSVTLSPSFTSGTKSYTASVANSVGSVTVTPTANSTITVNGTAVTSGTASGSIALSVGANTITIVTTAQDGTTQDTYTVSVTRRATRTIAIDTNSFTATYAMTATPPTLTSTPSAGASDGTKSYASSTTGVCTVNSSTGLVAFVSAGTCSLTATISAGTSNDAATSTAITFTTTLATQTVTWAPTTALLTTDSPATPSALASALGSAAITYSVTSAGTTGCTVNSSTGVLTFTAAGSCAVRASAAATASYAAATRDVTFVISQATRTITVTQSSNGTIAPGTTTANYGSNQTFTFTPATGYSVASITVNGTALSGSALTNAIASGYTFSNVTSTHTLTATYSAVTYTITYKAGTGGSGTDLTQTFVYGNTATLKDATAALTKTGYAISGWSTTDGGAKTNNLSAAYSAAADLILYPVWSVNTYTITYKAGTGGSGTDLTQTFVYGNTATLKDATAALTKAGYAISGWSTSDGGAKTNDLSAAYSSASNLTLYPVWSANTYTITYKAGPDGTGTDLTQTFVFGNTATLNDATAALTRSGYSISGWTTGSTTGAAKTNDLSSSYSSAANLTLYPVWGPITYTITYKAGTGGSGSDLTQTFVYGTTATVKDSTAALTKTGFAISGWSTTDGGTQSYALSGSYSAASNINLYPVWSANTYTITYKRGTNGTGVDVVQTFVYGATATLGSATTALIRVGYTITGWATTDGGSKTNDLSSSYSSAANLNLYPVWGANTYTVTYDATTNGGTALSPDTSSFTVAESALTLKTPVARTGYTPSGWYTAATGGTKIGNAGAGGYSPTSDITLYFQWTPIAYTVTYAGNSNTGGTVPVNASTYNIGNSVTVAGNPNSLVRTGYTFAGWTDNSSGTGTVYTSGTGYTVGSSNITFTAKWTANTYTITYNPNGGSGEGSATSDTYTTGGSTVTFPTVGSLARTGYTFDGWSATPTGSKLSTGYTTAVDVTLYAKWNVKVISVTYDKGVATGASIASWPSNDSGNYNTTIVLGTPTSQVTISGGTYQFSSWKVSGSNATYEAGSSYTLPASNPTLVAQWVQVFEVNYTFNGGTSATGFNYDAQCDPSTYLCLNNQQIQADAAPSRTGYTFTGWRDQSGNPIAAGATFTVTLNRYLLSAQWTANNYAITYVPAGGATTPSPLSKQYLQTFTVANDPGRDGYTFGGWSDGTLTYGAGAIYTVGTTAVTLTALWTANVYTISYDWNGGSGNATSPSSFTVGNSAVPLPLVTGHTKDGYDFAGWSTSSTGTSAITSYTPTQSLTLYAVWTPGTYTITYDGNGGTAASASATIANGSAISLVNATRTSYVFDGWYSASSGGSLIGLSGAAFTPALSRTLYARWTQLSLSGIAASALTYIGTLSASSSVSGSFSGSSGGSSVSVSVPAGSLPAGTNVNLHLVGDFSRAQSVISNANNYVVSMVVSWVAADGTVPDTDPLKPVTVVISNSTIKRGMKVYGIAGPTVEVLGTATVDGSITVSLTKDPEVVVAATKPGAPTGVSATSGADASSVVSWTAPASNGGSEITGYTATSSSGQTCSTTTLLTCSITGLANGTAVTFTVKAINVIGQSDASSASSAATPAGASSNSGNSNNSGGGGRVNTPNTDSNTNKPVVTVEKKSEKTTLTWSGTAPVAVTIESSTGTKRTETVTGNTFALPVPKPGEGYKVSADAALNNGELFKDFIVAEPPTKPVTLNVAPNRVSQSRAVVRATWKATSSFERFTIKITPTSGASRTIVTSNPSALINLVPGKKYTITVTAIGFGDLKSKVLTKVVTAPKKR